VYFLLIKKINADVIIRHDIFMFDSKYINTRLRRKLINWPSPSRIRDVEGAYEPQHLLTSRSQYPLKPYDYFTLWPKVERPSVSTNQISRNPKFGLSTLHTMGKSPPAMALQSAYMVALFDQNDGLSRRVWVEEK